MNCRYFGVAAAIALIGTVAGAAPVEPPPEVFLNAVYVDSAGCAFARAELGGDVIWAEIADPQGRPDCGRTPSLGAIISADELPEIPPNRSGTAPDFPTPGIYAQVGAFTGSTRADTLAAQLQGMGLSVLRQDFPRRSRPLRVLFVGPFPDDATAERARTALRRLGYTDAFLWTQD